MIYLLSLICALLPTYLIRFSIFGIPTTVLETIIYFAFLIQIYLILRSKLGIKNYEIRNKKFISHISYIIIPIALFFVAIIISTIIAPDKRAALGIAKAWFLTRFCSVHSSPSMLNPKKILEKLCMVLRQVRHLFRSGEFCNGLDLIFCFPIKKPTHLILSRRI